MIVQQATANNNGHGRTSVQIVQKHTKNTGSKKPAFWHKSGVFYIGGVFSFFQASKEQANRRVPLSHTQPVLTSATAPHILHPIHTPPNPLKTQQTLYLSHFYLFLLIFAIKIISTNSTRITFISFTFDGDSFYFCLLFHHIQPYLYPFIQTK